LVFVNYNQRLQERYEEKCLANDFDAIAVDDLNWSSEWMTGQDGASNEFVYGETGLTWASIEEAMGINEPVGTVRRYQRRVLEDIQHVEEDEDIEEYIS